MSFSSQHCVYVILEISLETYTKIQIISISFFAFPFNTPIDCVSYAIYTQQIDAVSIHVYVLLMNYLVHYMHIVCHCLLNTFNSVSTFTINMTELHYDYAMPHLAGLHSVIDLSNQLIPPGR